MIYKLIYAILMSTSKKRNSVQEVPAPAHLHRCYGHPHSRELCYKDIITISIAFRNPPICVIVRSLTALFAAMQGQACMAVFSLLGSKKI